ncbi:MAG: tRNA (adenosine(37)-N6)-threonylcarbamoyltransferase complex ATPase subunit type 1 TsaE [Pseudomonadota bacterium]
MDLPLGTHRLASERATAELAGRCALALAVPADVHLRGTLGVGKTTFARYFLRALGHEGAVKSPTYTLVEPYQLEHPSVTLVYHFDLYRIDDPLELELAGFQDAFNERALRLIEWPERGAGWLPPADVVLDFELHDGARRVEVRLG